ncbi:MAG: hypothetical protein M5U12_18620 [Verrucomicrobia bacterium]|nr:hypothetical protein [Verrucomicrobiota bacterium]
MLRWNIEVVSAAGERRAYAPFETPVAEEAIDPYVVYRRLKPLYSTYRHLGVYERHLESFEERPVLRNETIGQGCVNCHTFLPGAPDRFALSFRGRAGPATLLVQSNRMTRVDRKLGYLAWHPNGKLLAFADNEITQFFHLAGPMNRDVYDARSDLGILHVENRQVEKPAALGAPDRNENWPCWSPDGRHLYYCSGPVLAFEEARRFRYDLHRIPYDPDRNQWGRPERLLAGAEHGLSAHQPRVSPMAGTSCSQGVSRAVSRSFVRRVTCSSSGWTPENGSGCRSTASTRRPGIVGRPTGAGCYTSAADSTACSRACSSRTWILPAGSRNPCSCLRKTRRTTTRAWTTSMRPNWPADPSRFRRRNWPGLTSLLQPRPPHRLQSIGITAATSQELSCRGQVCGSHQPGSGLGTALSPGAPVM